MLAKNLVQRGKRCNADEDIPVVFTENFWTVQKLAEATKGVMESLGLDPQDCDGPIPDLNALPNDAICLVPQPKYIIIRAEDKLIPI